MLQKRPLQKDIDCSSQTTPNSLLTPPPKRRKVRGQNKHRPSIKLNFADQLCPSLHSFTHECPYKEKCRYSHSVADFLQVKLPDISDTCYMYTTFGYCPSGVACRYGRGHISPEGKSVVNECIYDENRVSIQNMLTKPLQINLRKKKLKFIRTKAFLKSVSDKEKDVATIEDGVVTNEEDRATNEGVATNEDVVINEEGVVTNKESVVTNEEGGATNEEGVVSDVPTNKEKMAINEVGVVVEESVSSGPFTNEDKIKLRPLEKKTVSEVINLLIFLTSLFYLD